MLWTIAVVLIILWLLGLVIGYKWLISFTSCKSLPSSSCWLESSREETVVAIWDPY